MHRFDLPTLIKNSSLEEMDGLFKIKGRIGFSHENCEIRGIGLEYTVPYFKFVPGVKAWFPWDEHRFYKEMMIPGLAALYDIKDKYLKTANTLSLNRRTWNNVLDDYVIEIMENTFLNLYLQAEDSNVFHIVSYNLIRIVGGIFSLYQDFEREDELIVIRFEYLELLRYFTDTSEIDKI